MLNINIRDGSVEIDGYVNVVERLSKLLPSRAGSFRERIKAGAFRRAIGRNDDIHILLNHDWQRDLGSTKKGNLELSEDNIGLHARAVIDDADVVGKAKHGDLVGWSFGFTDRDVDTSPERGVETRDVKDLDLYEVSILDRTRTPAYDGTSVMTRDTGETIAVNVGADMLAEAVESEGKNKPETDAAAKPENKPVEEREKPDDSSGESNSIDYGEWEQLIAGLKED